MKEIRKDEVRELRKEVDLWEYVEKVMPIVKDVKENGSEALKEYVKKFDNYKGCLELSPEDVGAYARKELVELFEKVLDHLVKFHESMVPRNTEVRIGGIVGVTLWEPIEKLGAYVPGGLYPYPSTVLMTAGLAKRLGVKEVVVATPPKAATNEAVASALYASGVDSVILAGGAHGIAALAYMAKVHKIVGPGGPYVQAAKVLVSTHVPIDMIAGPTELVVVADSNADPEEVAYDMLAQAEHGPMSFALLVTDSIELASKVNEIVEKYEEEVEGDLYYTIVDNMDEAIEVVNEVAPEHVSMYTDSYELPVAGAVSISTPSPLIDYTAGPNHVLPTSGWARARGPLGVIDFFRWSSTAKAYPQAKELFELAIKIAELEGMRYHKKALEKGLHKFY